MSLPGGTRLRRYELRAPIGAGGMGEVYLARDVELERDVAIKVLPPDATEKTDRLLRFAQEAKLSSALNHPNVAHVYEIGDEDGIRFIAMELVQGETLRKKLGQAPLETSEALSIAEQMAMALAAAHEAGIVHRDIKPENVMIRPDGYIKVLDFGLAKLREFRGDDATTALKTDPGVTVGTLQYMAPEQLAGGDVDHRSDLYSLGVVLYEMLTGRRPFEANDPPALMASILTKAPIPLTNWRSDLPSALRELIERAIAKNPSDRHADAKELLAAIRKAKSAVDEEAIRSDERARHSGDIAIPRGSRRALAMGAVVLVVIVVAVVAAMMLVRKQRAAAAEKQIADAEAMLAKDNYVRAYELATSAAAVLKGDERAAKVIAATSQDISIETDPAGAKATLLRFHGGDAPIDLGTTPVKARIPVADYILTIEKAGYATIRRPLSQTPFQSPALFRVDQPPPKLKLALLPSRDVPPGMVLVPASGTYQLVGYLRESDRGIALGDYFIDEREVSNRDFQEFVRDGGYRRPELWRDPFVKDGKTLTFDEAMALLSDSSGVPGPREWSGGAARPGTEDHPVTGVSWYEAAAYAQWKGKSLPTVYQWEKAARSDDIAGSVFGFILPWGLVTEGVDAAERANFSGTGTVPVNSMPFGISPYGAYHMAGNVSEWMRNTRPPGHAARGGSWNDAVYAFGQTSSYPPFYAAPTIGFRCVKERGNGESGDFGLKGEAFSPRYTAVGDAEYASLAARYDYRKEPPQAEVIERIETEDWTREKILFRSGDQKVPMYLWLPKGFARPLQLIHFLPAGDVARGIRSVPGSVEIRNKAILRSGRAIFVVVLPGYLERPNAKPDPPMDSPEYVDEMVGQITELRRGIDYLETRKDVDTTKLAMLAPSAGSWHGVIVAALETRYRGVMLVGSGIDPADTKSAPAGNRINFAPRIGGTKLMLQGRYDESDPLISEGQPLFALLTEPKKLDVYEGGHVPNVDFFARRANEFFDETLGKVGR